MSRMVKYDILRVEASFSIVLLHVSASYWSVVDIYGRDFMVMTIYNSLTRFAVPVFFMLSGLFLVTPERENVTVGKRVLNLIVLFYVWSAFYAFQGIAVDTIRGAFSMEVFRAAVERFIFGHVHMWFLHINSSGKTNLCQKESSALLSDFMDCISVCRSLPDRHLSSEYSSGPD